MVRKWLAAMAMVGLAVSTASAQDAKTVLANASKAMGVDGLNSIHFYGTGAERQPRPEQQRQPAVADGDANDYVRAIDFAQPASRATWVTYAVPVTGGRAALARDAADAAEHHAGQTTAWAQQLEIWITPWGFLKGAAANNATVRAQTVGGRRYQVVTWNAPVKSPGGQPYRRRRLHQRAEPGRARADVARESDLRRHARRGRIHATIATTTA